MKFYFSPSEAKLKFFICPQWGNSQINSEHGTDRFKDSHNPLFADHNC